MVVFYRVANVPVHSCLALETREEAVGFPRGEMVLAFCEQCGFIANIAFDPGLGRYDDRYTDQQCHSARFRAFQSEQVQHLVSRYSVRRKRVAEIGCGAGDFLKELCRRGENRGIGIDPRCPTDSSDHTPRIRFERTYFTEEYGKLSCDLVCCRHTLEHIDETGRLVSALRGSLHRADDALVFIEVPNARRIIQEGAFWDIYYEHCSYFTTESLKYLFQTNRFHVEELTSVYEDQYLTLFARPVDMVDGQETMLTRELAQVAAEAKEFADSAGRTMDHWRRRMTDLRQCRKRVAVWGAGSKCVSLLTSLDRCAFVDFVVDINPAWHGKYLAGSGVKVTAPEDLPQLRPNVIVVMNPIYRGEILHKLHELGVEAELVTT